MVGDVLSSSLGVVPLSSVAVDIAGFEGQIRRCNVEIRLV